MCVCTRVYFDDYVWWSTEYHSSMWKVKKRNKIRWCVDSFVVVHTSLFRRTNPLNKMSKISNFLTFDCQQTHADLHNKHTRIMSRWKNAIFAGRQRTTRRAKHTFLSQQVKGIRSILICCVNCIIRIHNTHTYTNAGTFRAIICS